MTLLVPAVYFFLSYQYLLGSLDVQAELSARTISGIVIANPETWTFEQVRLAELLERRSRMIDALQVRSILDKHGRLVAKHGPDLPSPVVARSYPVYDSGTPEGWIVITQSLRPLLYRSVAGGVIAFLLGLLVFIAVISTPMRAVAEARRNLDESERRYRSLFESMKEGVAVFRISDPGEGKPAAISLLDANPSWERMLDLHKEDHVDTDVSGLFDGEMEKHLPEIIRRAHTGKGFDLEIEEADRQQVFGVSVFYPKPGVFATLVEDLTEARKAREEQKRAEAEKHRLEEKVRQAQKLESLGVLAGGIAHDFNNILMAVLGHAELALEETSPMSAARGSLAEITTAARRAADLCRQMLAYAGKASFALERMMLRDLVEEMAHLLKTAISKKVILNLNLEGGIPPILADPSQIRQIVMNLIINASEAIGDRSGVITVSVGATRCDEEYLSGTEMSDNLAPGLYVHLIVTDTGIGMDTGTRSRIFEPFFSTKFTGRGLGLAAVLGIVRAHKGGLKVYSEPGKGTTFKILFPALTEGEDAPRSPEFSPLADWRGKGTILLVDDEESLVALGARMLEHLGFTVLTATDGLDAVELYRARGKEIDLVLMDLTMPHMDGAEAFGELRRLNPDVRVVLASGYSHEDVASRFAGKSLDGVLQKPYTLLKLREALVGLMPKRRDKEG
ncbi:MAG: response regulator [bacterium]